MVALRNDYRVNREGILILQQHEYLLHPLAVLMSYTFMEYRANCDFCYRHYYSIILFTFAKQTEGPILKLSSTGKNNLFLKASYFKKVPQTAKQTGFVDY